MSGTFNIIRPGARLNLGITLMTHSFSFGSLTFNCFTAGLQIKCTYDFYANMIDAYEIRCSYKIIILKHDEYLVQYIAKNNNFPKNTNIRT